MAGQSTGDTKGNGSSSIADWARKMDPSGSIPMDQAVENSAKNLPLQTSDDNPSMMENIKMPGSIDVGVGPIKPGAGSTCTVVGSTCAGMGLTGDGVAVDPGSVDANNVFNVRDPSPMHDLFSRSMTKKVVASADTNRIFQRDPNPMHDVILQSTDEKTDTNNPNPIKDVVSQSIEEKTPAPIKKSADTNDLIKKDLMHGVVAESADEKSVPDKRNLEETAAADANDLIKNDLMHGVVAESSDEISILKKRNLEETAASDANDLIKKDLMHGVVPESTDEKSVPEKRNLEETAALENGSLHVAIETGKEEMPIDDKSEERKKQQSRVHQLLRPGNKPSFVALVSPNEYIPPPIIIHVDEYLGLKRKRTEAPTEAKMAPNQTIRSPTTSSALSLASPSDEGWYEGVTPLALPGEAQHLNELHCFVRSHLELFSATSEDVKLSMPGRRTKTVRGKVGIRCIHCSKAREEAKASGGSTNGRNWPAGAVSYPLNIACLYSICAQKPQLHFEKCPNVSIDIKTQLYRLTHDVNGNPKRQRKSGESEGRGIGTNLYYTVSAKQMGLVDVDGGMRFGRDLTLAPLPMETILVQLQASPTKTYGASPAKAKVAAPSAPRVTADEKSEAILAAAVAEKDDEKTLLGRSEDKNLVTDFLFLCVRQMAICHAVESDFSYRGKRSKLMRLGFAGFCCRHCSDPSHQLNASTIGYANPTCRSFSSAPDNLASTISNTFYGHLEKCNHVPSELRSALIAYKRIHARQIQSLPYGGQRRLFHLLWSRLRAADVSEEEMAERIKNAPVPVPLRDTAVPGVSGEGAGFSPVSPVPEMVGSSTIEPSVWVRPAGFPVCQDDETNKALKRAEEDGFPISGDQLLFPSDRQLVSDYVFLMMKQLKAAHPTPNDYSRGKRTTHAGMRCMHCMHEDPRLCATGRSFPSHPDNIATTLNTSLYQHILKCPKAPDDIKNALVQLKKIHSIQRSSLRFGSQRRFFGLLFSRLRGMTADATDDDVLDLTEDASDDALERYGFVQSVGDSFVCQFCRMVPFSLRAPNSVSLARPTLDFASGHCEVCAHDSFDLSFAVEALSEAVSACPALLLENSLNHSFKDMIRIAVGGDDKLYHIFSDVLLQLRETQRSPKGKDTMDLSAQSRSLWKEFPSTVDVDQLEASFKELAGSIPGLSPNLGHHKKLVKFLRIISPSLVVPVSEKPDLYTAQVEEEPGEAELAPDTVSVEAQECTKPASDASQDEERHKDAEAATDSLQTDVAEGAKPVLQALQCEEQQQVAESAAEAPQPEKQEEDVQPTARDLLVDGQEDMDTS